MKTLAFLISNLSNSGGTQRMLSLLCNELVGDYKIVVITSEISDSIFYPLDKNVEICNLSNDKMGLLKRNFEIYKILKKVECDYYINIDSNSTLFNGFLLPRKTKLIIWEHFSLENNVKKWHFKLSRLYSTIRAKKLVLLSNFEKELWIRYYKISPEKVDVIYNPLPFEITSESYQNRYKNKTIIAIGNNSNVKGFDILLEAWRQIKSNWQLKIIGVSERDKKELGDTIKNNSIKNVSVNGRIKDIEKVYKNASVFVLSSRREATPLVLLESQANGLPVVAFDHLTSVKEIGADSVLYASYNDKERSLGNAIRSLIESEKKYNEYHEKSLNNSKRFVTQNFVEAWKINLK